MPMLMVSVVATELPPGVAPPGAVLAPPPQALTMSTVAAARVAIRLV
jgi:hypothetical protein